MHRFTAILMIVAIAATACSAPPTSGDLDILALVQANESTDVVVVRVVEDDYSDALGACHIAHGETRVIDTTACAIVDPLRFTRSSLFAHLDPGPDAELLIVTHELAEFRLTGITTLDLQPTVEISIPAGVVTFDDMVLAIHLAHGHQAAGVVTGCLDTGLAGLEHPVLVTAATEPGASPEAAQADPNSIGTSVGLTRSCLS